MNRTGFNGLYRENSQGFNNVPFWKYSNPTICDEETILLDSKALQNTTILLEDFEYILKHAKKEDFVYLDPPYDPLTSTANFTGYNKWGFWKEEQKRLFKIYEKLDKRGCYLMLSNHNTDFINKLYKNYHKYTVLATRMVNANAIKRWPVEETVILNYVV
jgi:DNA adenine methylase